MDLGSSPPQGYNYISELTSCTYRTSSLSDIYAMTSGSPCGKIKMTISRYKSWGFGLGSSVTRLFVPKAKADY